MLIIPDWLSSQPLGRTVFTIGVFDGLHLGHQALIKRVIERANELSATSLALTFSPHPLVVLSPSGAPETLTTFEQKVEILRELDLMALGRLRFDRAMSDLLARDFLDRIIATRLKPVEIFIGPDFHFGRGAEGNFALIKEWGQSLPVPAKVFSIEQVKGPGGETYSSSHIRGLIKVGLVREAANILGRPYRISGVVEVGQARGRCLGYPTANLGQSRQLTPGPGVYAVRVKLGEKTLYGMTSVGHNPTFSSKVLTVETNIFDFNGDCYGEKLDLEFMDWLRGVIRFDSAASLTRQLGEDEKMARAVLGLS
ncbi:MAG: riboflavin biosynthesis protein RibF [Deltaproteobacteria bacterium]|jgi:riboflavin kinase/FMN adenylyltransferase|nr:riboflavin biosynthesis protein RibF [Deltaproteobacteria bacterium]